MFYKIIFQTDVNLTIKKNLRSPKKTSKPQAQHPEKLQAPNFNQTARANCFDVWSLEFL
jgi:hypothetical protein